MRSWTIENTHITCTCFFVTVVCAFAIILYVGRKSPVNYIILLVFTLSLAYSIAGCTAKFDRDKVMLAAIMIALVAISLMVYAMLTKVKLEVFWAFVTVNLLAMLPTIIVGILLRFPWL